LKNDPRYEPIYQAALARPGVVVLHEAVLHRLLLGCLSEEQYREEFVFNYGEWLRPLAIEMWNERFTVQPGGRYFEFPMLRRLAEASHAIVVHNPKAHRIVQEELAGSALKTRVFEIPHWVEAPESVDQAAVAALRERLEIPQDAVVISCFGPLRPEMRLRSLLEAVQAVSVPCRLVLAGSFDDSEYETALLPLLQSTPLSARTTGRPPPSWPSSSTPPSASSAGASCARKAAWTSPRPRSSSPTGSGAPPGTRSAPF
jgi:glycosyltransferase involved in cell wall biosynthesis